MICRKSFWNAFSRISHQPICLHRYVFHVCYLFHVWRDPIGLQTSSYLYLSSVYALFPMHMALVQACLMMTHIKVHSVFWTNLLIPLYFNTKQEQNLDDQTLFIGLVCLTRTFLSLNPPGTTTLVRSTSLIGCSFYFPAVHVILIL